ncbi:MAG: DUF4132 domain-containing protein, partial [Pseudomonadota bacterium]
TQDELRDRVVPWLGFTPGAPRIVDCAGKLVEVRIGLDFSVEYRDVKTGKPVRSLPKTVLAETAAELAELKSMLKEAASAQSLRLQNLLVVAHRWSVDLFRERFLVHPLLFPFTVRLVWGGYDEHGTLVRAFRARASDSVLVDVAGQEIGDAVFAAVGMVHPLELAADALAAWRTALSAAGVTQPQPLVQLDRPVLRLGADKEEMDAYTA